jgi:hypothetical protein
MPVERIAIISEVPALTLAELEPVVAALQRQIDEDFGPLWSVQARLTPIPPGERAPPGAWRLTIQEELEGGQSGFHHDEHGRPRAVIEYTPDWSLTASHELLEMLVDPLGNRILPGPSPTGGKDEVHFLVEVCDPCQAPRHSYTIDGVTVSDFLTPAFYEVDAPPGTPCSFKGSVGSPFEVLEGGYITWQVPHSHMMWQDHWPLGGERAHRELGRLPNLLGEQQRLREWVDKETLRKEKRAPRTRE